MGSLLHNCVRSTWPCLGITVASKVVVRPDGGRAQLELIRAGSWAKGLDKMGPRVGLLGHSHSSCSRRSSGWNTYGSPLTLYPSHAVLPGPRERRVLMGHLATALVKGSGKWCPLFVYTALGPLFGISGGPRCPVATARTTGALAWRRGDMWGVPLAGREMAAWWAKAVL